MKKIRWIIALVLLTLIAGLWAARRRPRNLPEAYVSERSATLWSSLAQVRQPVATLHYGEKVAVVERRAEQVNVRTVQGATGWMEARLLMDAPVWQRSAQLLAETRAMPLQAVGRTKVVSNLRLNPGRDATRVYQFGRGNTVEVLSRTVAEWSEDGKSANKDSDDDQKPRREDWLLVRGFATPLPSLAAIQSGAGKEQEIIEVAGWVLARFIELTAPSPIREYASSAGMRVVAWFELNRVAEDGGEKPQYLTAGARGGEGQPCDFTLIRVYTWGVRRKRYETAYVESNLCGKLPIRVGKDAAGDPEFRFGNVEKGGTQERRYQMRQTSVRRVREAGRAGTKSVRKPR